jgi:hypothetical protein
MCISIYTQGSSTLLVHLVLFWPLSLSHRKAKICKWYLNESAVRSAAIRTHLEGVCCVRAGEDKTHSCMCPQAHSKENVNNPIIKDCSRRLGELDPDLTPCKDQ